MKVYRPDAMDRSISLHVAPGVEHPITDWLMPDGKPKQICVQFVLGVADVPDNLGRYLIDTGHAKRSPLILPEAA